MYLWESKLYKVRFLLPDTLGVLPSYHSQWNLQSFPSGWWEILCHISKLVDHPHSREPFLFGCHGWITGRQQDHVYKLQSKQFQLITCIAPHHSTHHNCWCPLPLVIFNTVTIHIMIRPEVFLSFTNPCIVWIEKGEIYMYESWCRFRVMLNLYFMSLYKSILILPLCRCYIHVRNEFDARISNANNHYQWELK